MLSAARPVLPAAARLCARVRPGTQHRAARMASVAPRASSVDPPPPPRYHLLQYSYVPDLLEKRGPHRAAHIEGAKQALAAGKLYMAGALADPVDGAIFIFR